MSESTSQVPPLGQLLDRMVAAKQLSATDAKSLALENQPGSSATVQNEEDILRWLAKEYGLTVSQITNYLALARREFRRIVLEKLHELTATEEEFRREARALLGVDIK